MYKYIFLLLFSLSLYGKEYAHFNGDCIYDLNYDYSQNSFNYKKVQNELTCPQCLTHYLFNQSIFDSIVNSLGKFEYRDGKCYMKTVLSTNGSSLEDTLIYGMTETQFNFVSALTGLLTGFLICLIVFLRIR